MASIINPYRFAAAAGGGGCDYVEATGGTITTDGDYKLHTFTSSGTFEVTCAGSTDDTVQYMVAAGGGGGGGTIGGGGGGGGLLTSTSYQVSAGKYEVIIGAGGAIGSATVQGSDGTLSSFGGMSPAEPTAAFTSTTDCKLLLHSDTTNGSTTFTDSTGNFSLSATGNAQHSTADQKFGATSISMDGTTDEVIFSTTDTTMGGSSAHTVECWFNTSSTAYQYLVCRNSSQQYAGLSINPTHATNNIIWGGNATGTVLYAAATINTGTWYHVAVVMDGTGAEIFFDGERVASVASFGAWGYATASDNITIGSQHYTGSSHRYTLNGYIDEVRWSDVARYSYSTAASAIGGGGGGCDGITSGRSGGSGGGGGETGSGSGNGGSGTVGQGNDGGDADGMNLSGGGGGGAGGAAYDVSGGDGAGSNFTMDYYCGGGGGSSRYDTGYGGMGGGGDGAIGQNTSPATAGSVNTGGGGGGGDSGASATPAAGGSGTVLVYYQFQSSGGP